MTNLIINIYMQTTYAYSPVFEVQLIFSLSEM